MPNILWQFILLTHNIKITLKKIANYRFDKIEKKIYFHTLIQSVLYKTSLILKKTSLNFWWNSKRIYLEQALNHLWILGKLKKRHILIKTSWIGLESESPTQTETFQSFWTSISVLFTILIYGLLKFKDKLIVILLIRK